MFELPKLKYDYNSLSPYISENTMSLHHDKHHKTYTDKINETINDNPDLNGKSIEQLLTQQDFKSNKIKSSIINNGGGYYNHSLFWDCMAPHSDAQPEGKLLELIIARHGSFIKFVDKFTASAMSVFGSGWVWLQPNGDIITTNNQINPISMGLDAPLMCLDVWEHAYYIDYNNRRNDYINSWWNVINWHYVNKRLESQF